MPAKYPFAQMKIGDSFFIEGERGSVISGSIQHWNKKLAPAKFVTRIYDDKDKRQVKGGVEGVRVFRVK